MILLLLAALAADAPTTQCPATVRDDPAGAERVAGRWALAGGGTKAGQCLGVALAAQSRFDEAASAFEGAARSGETAHDPLAATCWAQAGNAWLAAGQPAKARLALDAALASGDLDAAQRGEASLDRARALVAAGDTKAARADLDAATRDAADDPLTWLLSATLARRTGDLPRAKADIAQALARSPDDAQVQLEAGNIAALTQDEAGAKAAWAQAARLAPQAPAGLAATQALAQFGPAPAK